ncbi:VC0807 family protein [Pseudomonas sp. NY15364]|uniref:MFS transporter n=1 Tax=Pseudomonas sediminis TaxID=1691904 RepID=A0ABX6SGL6_9PSED|nr:MULTISPECIES: VC0807 family protein [Pseudomonas]MDG9756805.1 MFS transporter [Pseudomonas sediminis]PKQ42588.1 MFS transporter [Pseudomonas sp. YY-1]QNH00722.1 MFS transporter [Pseudomonas sediminis]RRV43069.1 MFS transporter [Pseudomonas sp. o96-267]
MTATTDSRTPTHKPRPLIDLAISILIPSFILMKLSGEHRLGADGALILALAFPLAWGAFELIKYRKFNFIALLGLISVALTGGIGLLKLDTQWLAVKEALIPGLIGIAVLVSTRTRYPLIRTLLFNKTVLNIDKIHDRLEQGGHVEHFETRLMRATYWLSGTFFFSSFMNYVLAKWIVVSPAGTEAFNDELGRMTLLSYPMIAIPSMIMLMAIFYYLWKTIHGLTGLSLEEIMANTGQESQP